MKFNEIACKRITKDNVNDFFHSGVWVMFGKCVSCDTWDCLNVGKNVNIGKELKADFERIDKARNNIPFVQEKEYYNQFGVKKFVYTEFPSRLDQLYAEIADNYTEIFAVEVYDKSDYEIEKYCAYLFEANYWVSNGKNMIEIGRKQIDEIIQKLRNSMSPDHEKVVKSILELYHLYIESKVSDLVCKK